MMRIIAIGGAVLALIVLWTVGLGLHQVDAPEWFAAIVAVGLTFLLLRKVARLMNWLEGDAR